MNPENEKQFGVHSTLTIKEAAAIVNLDPRTLKVIVDRNEIKSKWVGNRKRVIYGSLMVWLYGDKDAAAAAVQFLSQAYEPEPMF
jgi:hypothetical protein